MNSFQIQFSYWLKKTSHKAETLSKSYKCGICGKAHSNLPMDMSYENPAGYFKIPQNERAKRIHKSSDICVIDNKEFYIRGVLPLPVIDSGNEFRWGVWAKVNEPDFKIYIKYWDIDIPENVQPLRGYLSGGLKYYPESDMLPVEIRLQARNQRPIFRVLSDKTPLGIDQQKGIAMEKVHSFVEPLLK